jgi:hypothetical protein
MKLLNLVFDLVVEQVDPATAASGPQKCAATDSRDRQNSRDNKADRNANAKWDAQVRASDSADRKQQERENANFLSLKYDRYGTEQLDRNTYKQYVAQYQDFMKQNPGVLESGDGLKSDQKYAVVSKILSYVKNTPQISYSRRLGMKYGLNQQSTLNDVIGVVNKMGGFGTFVEWYNAGGPELK